MDRFVLRKLMEAVSEEVMQEAPKKPVAVKPTQANMVRVWFAEDEAHVWACANEQIAKNLAEIVGMIEECELDYMDMMRTRAVDDNLIQQWREDESYIDAGTADGASANATAYGGVLTLIIKYKDFPQQALKTLKLDIINDAKYQQIGRRVTAGAEEYDRENGEGDED